ncbi:MAG: hypothetical protein FWF36_02650 [Propionibacteriaceae bacterium]|nr:hypothetical protein [Propionibacteriaceae bacterium]
MKRKLVTTIVVCALAVVLLVGGYFVLRATMNATMSAGDGQSVTATDYPTPTVPSQTGPSSSPPIDLQVRYVPGPGDATPQAQDLSADQAAQTMAAAAQRIFGVDVSGAAVDMTYNGGATVIWSTASIGEDGTVTIGPVSGTAGTVITGPVTATAPVVYWFEAQSDTWSASLTTASNQKVTATIDAVTGQIYSMANAFPTTNWTCPGGTQTTPTSTDEVSQAGQQATQAMNDLIIADFVTSRLAPTGQIATASTVCTASSGARKIEFSMVGGGAYLVFVDANNTVYGFRYFSDASLVTVDDNG